MYEKISNVTHDMIYDYIVKYITDNGYPLTIKEMCKGVVIWSFNTAVFDGIGSKKEDYS